MKLSILALHKSKFIFSWLYRKYYILDNLDKSKFSIFEDAEGNLIKTYTETNIFYIRVLTGKYLGLYTKKTFSVNTKFYPLIKTKLL